MEESQREEISQIKVGLENYGYTKRLINQVYKRLRRPCLSADPVSSSRMCLPCVKNVSETIGRVLRKHGVGVTDKPCSPQVQSLGRLPLLKDRPRKENSQGLICRIPCADCPAAHVRETKNFPETLPLQQMQRE